MKSIDQLFCSSPASTAICSSTVQHAVIPHGGVRPIDRRRVHRLGHPPKARAPAPCSSHLPFDPIPQYQKARKSTSSSAVKPGELRRKSSADVSDLQAATATTSPPGSSRYLLGDSPFIHFLSSDDTNLARKTLVKRQPSNELPVFRSSSARSPLESPVYKPPSLTYVDDSNVKSFPSTPSHRNHQVVELRVSIHCKGCEGKVRKHLSRMEGVTSFSIDLYSKKVTVMGDVTPVGVLASLSKVKNAQLWPSPAAVMSSSSPRVGLTN
ncbi:PREDICTED: protein SODIUM POTASSIUM ROOT DEFECTIVE 3-like [Ipomoea nil]|uniref:protein SODIUM POTASSIUM ROOT DEFECTIVE 3-like n=1 Tax=Ipomoea nil TaxID=35883 RepID=UPI000901B23F|nr:PREDICTED: protein SODIUM POTASSIUM ROOT DEFECTIVE 3-like [Ipomoea nil]